MSVPGKTQNALPLFVPRSVTTSERAFSTVASRMMGPARTVATRAMSFADRLLTGWVGHTYSWINPAPTPSASAARLPPSALPMPRAWYREDIQTAQAAAAQAAAAQVAAITVRARAAAAAQAAAQARLVVAPQPSTVELPAERGAQIDLTPLAAPPEPVAAQVNVPLPPLESLVAPASAETPIASETLAPATTSAPLPTSATPTSPVATPPAATVTTPPAPSTSSAPAPTISASTTAAQPASRSGAPTVTAPASIAIALVADEQRVIQMLAASLPELPTVAPVAAAPRSMVERALAHAAWADAQLRPAPVAPPVAATVDPGTPRAAGTGYVFVTPPETRVVESAARTPARAPLAQPVVSASPAPSVEMPTVAPTAPSAASPVPMPRPTASEAPLSVERTVEASRAAEAAPASEIAAALELVAGPAPVAPTSAPTTTAPISAAPTTTAPTSAATTAAPIVAPASPVATTAGMTTTAAPLWGAPTSAPGQAALFISAPAALPFEMQARVSVALPDLRLTLQTLPTLAVGAQRLNDFIERLVGSQARRDAELPAATVELATTLGSRAPGVAYVRLEELRRAGDAPLPRYQAPSVASAPQPVTPAASAIAPLAMPTPSAARASETPAAPHTAETAPAIRHENIAAASESAPEATVASPSASPSTSELSASPLSTASFPLEATTDPFDAEAPRRAGWRPGSLGARAAEIATLVDERGLAAWGAPTSSARSAPQFAYVAPADAPRRAEPALAAASGPARYVDFVAQLVGSQAVRATAPLSIEGVTRGLHLEIVIEPPAPLASPDAPPLSARHRAQMPVVEAPREPAPRAGRAPAAAQTAIAASPAALPAPVSYSSMPPPVAASYTTASSAPGPTVTALLQRFAAVGLRAEQLSAFIGVRAADLSNDFIDPAALPALASARTAWDFSYLRVPPTGVVQSQAQTMAGYAPSTIGAAAPNALAAGGEAISASSMSPPSAEMLAPIVDRVAAGGQLSREEWALVATFPSAATAVQVAAARRSAQFLHDPMRVQPSDRPLLTVGPTAFSTLAPSARPASAGFTATAARPFTPTFASALQRAAGPTAERSVESSSGAAPILRNAERAPSEMVLPAPAAAGRGPLPGGRSPRGSYLWPRAAGFHTTTSVDEFMAPGAATAQAAELVAPGRPLWEAMRPPMPVTAADARAPRESDPDVDLARPFLQLVQGGVTSPSSGSGGLQFFEQPQPLVTAQPSSEAAERIVEAVRSAPTHAPTDDRITLADLTLISVASATGQIAAAGDGGGGAAPAAPAASGGGGGGGGGAPGGGGGGMPTPGEIDELARKVYDELQRLAEIERERSG